MFKPKQKSVMFAITVGVLGFIGAYLAGHAGIPKESDILVAARDIQPGQTIDAGSLTITAVNGQVPPTLLTRADIQKVVGKTVDYEIPAGVPISQSYITDSVQRDGLVQDQVGVWLPVSLENGGEVMPGDRVDIFAATNNAMTASGSPILSYVQVIRAVNSSGADINRAKQVSTIGATPVESPAIPAAAEIAVTSAQAAQLASLMQSSHLILALSPWPPEGSTFDQTETTPTAQPVQPAVPQQTTQPTAGQPAQVSQPAQGGYVSQPYQPVPQHQTGQPEQ